MRAIARIKTFVRNLAKTQGDYFRKCALALSCYVNIIDDLITDFKKFGLINLS